MSSSTKVKSSGMSQSGPRDDLGAQQIGDILRRSDVLHRDMANFTPQVTQDFTNSLNMMRTFAGLPSQTEQYLRPAMGTFAGNLQGGSDYLTGVMNQDPANNPFLDQMLADRTARGLDSAAARASAAGRYGSGAMGEAMSRAFDEADTAIRYQDYNQQQGRSDAAANLLYGTATQALPQFGSQLDNATTARIGIMNELGRAQNELATARQQAPLRATEWLNAIASPIAAEYKRSDQKSQSKQTGMNPMGLLGAGMQALSGFGGMGGGGGLFGGLFGGGGASRLF